MRKGYLGLMVIVLCFIVVGFASAQNQKAEWQKSKHANRELAADDAATWEMRKEATAHCGRCHSEQGFKVWVPQLLKGDPSPFKKPDGSKADEAYIKSLGLTKDKVQPVTCEACHSGPPALRIKDKYTLAAEWNSRKSGRQGCLVHGLPQYTKRSYYLGQP